MTTRPTGSRQARYCVLLSLAMVLLTALCYWTHGPRLAVLILLGGAVLLLAVPELEPKAYRHPALWQSGVGAGAGLMTAWLVGGGGWACLLGVLVGAMLGWLTPFWMRYLPLP